MRISFLLPFAAARPVGGFKVVFEYANRLTERGHEVTLIFPSYTFREGLLNNAKYAFRYQQRKIDKSYIPKWFELNKKVMTLWIKKIDNREMPEADALIATAWRTAKCSENLSESKGRKFYLIQHLETWNGPEQEVMSTWKLPFRKIVISKWLLDIANQLGEKAEYIPNGLDFAEFGIDTKPEEKDGARIIMLYSNLEFKGASKGLEAIESAMKDNDSLGAVLFGTCDRPHGLNGRIEYHKDPEKKLLRALYNSCGIYLGPSFAEGFGLTGAEALMCGCAIAVSNNGGHREYAIDNQTALMFEPGDAEQMKNALLKLVSNNDLRYRIAYRGNEYIRRFNWDSSVEKFEKVLMS